MLQIFSPRLEVLVDAYEPNGNVPPALWSRRWIQYTNSAFPFGTSAFPKNLACEIFNFFSCISAHIFLETSSLFVLKVSAFGNNKTGTHRTHRQKTSKALKNHCDLIKRMHQCCVAFWVGFGWMSPPQGLVFVAIPKKP